MIRNLELVTAVAPTVTNYDAKAACHVLAAGVLGYVDETLSCADTVGQCVTP